MILRFNQEPSLRLLTLVGQNLLLQMIANLIYLDRLSLLLNLLKIVAGSWKNTLSIPAIAVFFTYGSKSNINSLKVGRTLFT
jgi:hypothetical protein